MGIDQSIQHPSCRERRHYLSYKCYRDLKRVFTLVTAFKVHMKKGFKIVEVQDLNRVTANVLAIVALQRYLKYSTITKPLDRITLSDFLRRPFILYETLRNMKLCGKW